MNCQQLTEIRRQRGIEIAKRGGIENRGATWIVPSEENKEIYYIVCLDGENSRCNCDFFLKNNELCKHIFAVQFFSGMMTDPEWAKKVNRKTYPQNWQAYDESQVTEKFTFMGLLQSLVNDIDDAPYKFGRPKLTLKSMIFASALKVYTQFSLRRFMSDLQIAKDYKYVDYVPSFPSVGKTMRSKELTPILEGLIEKSALPLRGIEQYFAVDSTGMRSTKFTEYFNSKYSIGKAHKWVKLHVCIGVKTNIVTSAIIDEECSGDSPNFVPLVERTHNNGFDMKEVSADKAYLSRKNLECVEKMGGMPFIPFKSNDTPKPNYILDRPENLTWSKLYHYFMLNNEAFLEHYHKRSNVESTFSMMKRKFNDCLKSKSRVAQINEALLKILCHNIVVLIHEMNELGIKPNFF